MASSSSPPAWPARAAKWARWCDIPAIKVALAAVALSPAVAVLPAGDGARAQRTHAVTLIAASALLSILTLPMSFALLRSGSGSQLAIRPGDFAMRVVLSILLPLGAGLVLGADGDDRGRRTVCGAGATAAFVRGAPARRGMMTRCRQRPAGAG